METVILVLIVVALWALVALFAKEVLMPRRRPDPFERIADAFAEAVCILGRIEEKFNTPAPPVDDADELRKLEERIEVVKQNIAAGRASLADAVDRNEPPA